MIATLILYASLHGHRRRQFAEQMSDRLDICHARMLELKPYDKKPLELPLGRKHVDNVNDAYLNAIHDLDAYQGGSKLVTEERLRNDVSEVEDDLGGRMSLAEVQP